MKQAYDMFFFFLSSPCVNEKNEETIKTIKMKYLSEIMTEEHGLFPRVYHLFVESGTEVPASTVQKKITALGCSVCYRFQEHVHGINEYRLQPYQQWASLLKELGQLSLLHTQLGNTGALGEW